MLISSSVILAFLILTLLFIPYANWHLSNVHATVANNWPTINDPGLQVELVSEGLERPTSMAFLGPDDILVLEKDEGTVRRIINGTMLSEPLFDAKVSNESERGMLGIAVSKHQSGSTFVFLYYTEAETKDGEDKLEGKDPLGNRLYRYELVNEKLVNPTLVMDLPAKERKFHNGGVIEIGPDNNLYTVVGSVASDNINKDDPQADNGLILNVENGPNPDGRGGILRVTQDGNVVDEKGILGDDYPLNLYYAYGIRNSFGMDFDPVTGNLWDTENGPAENDEINLVEPGFNSGWKVIPGGMLSTDDGESRLDIQDLVDFDGRGRYSDPEFTWKSPVAPTAIAFLNSDKYGKHYENDMFVGDYKNGYVYHFDLNNTRTGLEVDNKIVDNHEELDKQGIIFGQGFNVNSEDTSSEQPSSGITDVEVGPDGNLYVVSIGLGAIFKIVPKTQTVSSNNIS
jgi:aldose sugar dehydrogenase